MPQTPGAINPTTRSAARPRLHALPPLRPDHDHTAWRELARLEQENRQLRWMLGYLAEAGYYINVMAQRCAIDSTHLADFYHEKHAPEEINPNHP